MTRRLISTVLVVGMLAGCSSSKTGSHRQSSPQATARSTTSSAATPGRHTLDPCDLLSDAQIAALVGGTTFRERRAPIDRQGGYVIGASSTHDQADNAACIHEDGTHAALVILTTMTSGTLTGFERDLKLRIATDLSATLGVPAIQRIESNLVYAILDHTHLVAVGVGNASVGPRDPKLSVHAMQLLLAGLR